MLQLSYGSMAGTGSPAVQKLQTALKALAQVAGRPIIDPGAADGIVGPRTVNAVIASMGLLNQHLGTTGGIIQAGLAVYSIADPAQANALITQYASRLEQAARSAAIIVAQQGGGATAPVPSPNTGIVPGAVMPGMAVSWYKTWWGIGGIALGAIGVIALIAAPRRAPAAKAA